MSSLLVVALALGILWVAAVAIVMAKRHIREITPGPETSEFGDESPAVAAFLANGFRLPAEAASATIIDLAARGVIKIEDYRPGLPMIRLSSEASAGLRPYETRVIQLLESKASGGIVPAEALSSGEGEISQRWRHAFRNEVVDEAQERGLSRDLWNARLTTIFALLSLLPAGTTLIARGWEPALGVFVAGLFILQIIRYYRPQQPTAFGLARASHWLGVRQYLSSHGEFDDVSPAGVAIWGRNLSYAAALEIARTAVKMLPMGDEDDRNAWSPWGGRWHPVKVRYPLYLPPMWGKHPAASALISILIVMAGGMAIMVGTRVQGLARGSSAQEASGITPGDVSAVISTVLPLVGLLLLLTGGVLLVRALVDLTSTKRVNGHLVRKRRKRRLFDSSHTPKYLCYLAVDDASSPRINAWRVRDEIFDHVEQGDDVVAEVTRYGRYVKSISKI